MNYTLKLQDNNICKIQPEGKISLELTADIAQHVKTFSAQHGLPAGLLIDVRFNALLSIVRLTNLLDTLSGFGIPLAVVFWNKDQQRLAELLHNTLIEKQLVAYFTEIDRAEQHLISGAANGTQR